MQVRCLIQRIQQTKPNDWKGHSPRHTVNLGECWIEETIDDAERYDRLRKSINAAGWSMHYYTKSDETGYFYNIIAY